MCGIGEGKSGAGRRYMLGRFLEGDVEGWGKDLQNEQALKNQKIGLLNMLIRQST